MMRKIAKQYCGRDFSPDELEIMRRIIAEDPGRTRAQISRLVCEALGWYKPDGGLKEMSCRVAMLRMDEDGLLKLPPPRHRIVNRCNLIQFTKATDPKPQISSWVDTLPQVKLELIASKNQSALWNEYIHRYHYLGYAPLPGAQLRYMALSNGNILALLGFGAAAWKIAPRDNFIGWDDQQRQKGLHLIVNNARFLILPWVKSKNLASKLLAMVTKQLPDDWQNRYGYKPVLVETFVEANRFKGICYKAANWIYVGLTKGRGKLGPHNANIPQKDIFLYPLIPTYKQLLIG